MSVIVLSLCAMKSSGLLAVSSVVAKILFDANASTYYETCTGCVMPLLAGCHRKYNGCHAYRWALSVGRLSKNEVTFVTPHTSEYTYSQKCNKHFYLILIQPNPLNYFVYNSLCNTFSELRHAKEIDMPVATVGDNYEAIEKQPTRVKLFFYNGHFLVILFLLISA